MSLAPEIGVAYVSSYAGDHIIRTAQSLHQQLVVATLIHRRGHLFLLSSLYSVSYFFIPCSLTSQFPLTMAAAIKAINAKIRSNKVLDYFCSTRE